MTEYLAAVAVARLVFGPGMRIQVPPNLSDPRELGLLISAVHRRLGRGVAPHGRPRQPRAPVAADRRSRRPHGRARLHAARAPDRASRVRERGGALDRPGLHTPFGRWRMPRASGRRGSRPGRARRARVRPHPPPPPVVRARATPASAASPRAPPPTPSRSTTPTGNACCARPRQSWTTSPPPPTTPAVHGRRARHPRAEPQPHLERFRRAGRAAPRSRSISTTPPAIAADAAELGATEICIQGAIDDAGEDPGRISTSCGP